MRLGLPLLGALMTERGHEVRIYAESLSEVDWDDVLSSDLVGHLHHHLHGRPGLPLRSAGARRRRPGGHGRSARDLPGRRGPGLLRLRRPQRGRRDPRRTGRLSAGPRAPWRTSSACRIGTPTAQIVNNPDRPLLASLDRPSLARHEPGGGRGEDPPDAHAGVAGLSVRLRVLLGGPDVRPPRARGRAGRGGQAHQAGSAREDLLLRRQLLHQQAQGQGTAARSWPRRSWTSRSSPRSGWTRCARTARSTTNCSTSCGTPAAASSTWAWSRSTRPP